MRVSAGVEVTNRLANPKHLLETTKPSHGFLDHRYYQTTFPSFYTRVS